MLLYFVALQFIAHCLIVIATEYIQTAFIKYNYYIEQSYQTSRLYVEYAVNYHKYKNKVAKLDLDIKKNTREFTFL
ncbi:hypothetical protein C1646_680688 [Rhizophagus diaphanus]|nr:hypothetical protein C1646_680688 [Rhizophagus diaphanus] [Rhizophagus sp. MUCL 43196]